MKSDQEQLVAYLAGTSTPEVEASIDARLAQEPAFSAELLAAADTLPDPEPFAGPFRASAPREPTPGDLARQRAVEAICAANRPRRSRQTPWVAAVAAVLLVGLAWGWRSADHHQAAEQLADLRAELCGLEAVRDSLPHPTAAGCPSAMNSMLGSEQQAAELAGVRFALEGSCHADDPAWIAARSLLGLLQQQPASVVELLEGHPEALQARPSLHADLALALRRTGQQDRAREALARGLALAPTDPVLLAAAALHATD